MLELCFARPQTVDRIRSAWIGPPIEMYVTWLLERSYAARDIKHRVPLLMHFGAYAQAHGAIRFEELPGHLDGFIDHWLHRPDARRTMGPPRPKLALEVRGPIEQMLRLVVPGFVGHTRRRHDGWPFATAVPGFVEYLREERGLSAETLLHYATHLRDFEAYLNRIGLTDLSTVSAVVTGGFLTDRCQGLARTSVRDRCGVLRVFLRYLHREGVLARDLSPTIEAPPVYRLAQIPRSITWAEVGRTLAVVDRRTALGRRDYAILLLLVTYGLRAREVAALTLDDLDWKHDRLHIPERKAGHSTAYPLSPLVGEAIVAYLKAGRPTTTSRRVFFRIMAPYEPIKHNAVSCRATWYMQKAGITVPRPGSHTLRHTCVQRLVDAGWALKQIGDYVGHRSPASTQVYSKVAIETLREVACGDGEEVV